MIQNKLTTEKCCQSSEYNEFDQIAKLSDDFSKISESGTIILDESGKLLRSKNSCDFDCCLCSNSKVLLNEFTQNAQFNTLKNSCHKHHLFSSEQSERFGGKYIYSCASNLVFVTVPIRKDNKIDKYIICGPLMPLNLKDFDVEDLITRLEIDMNIDDVIKFLETVPFCSTEKIQSISNIMFMLAKYISKQNNSDDKNTEIYDQQQKIGEYIQNVKAELIKDYQTYISYPFDTEKQLFYAITSNDLINSRRILNEILGHIFFSSANDLNIIKVRAIELSVMISRAAIEAGADINKIHQINIEFLSEFFNYTTIEEICWSLTEILKKFTRETFEFSNVKHIDLISKAVNYMKVNYMNKITLSEVADYVYLSPSYFSKIFKDEMKSYFSDYLSIIRVEKGKMLLLSENLSLVDIAEHTGFYDQSYFNKVFKKFTGVTPKKFREQNGNIRNTRNIRRFGKEIKPSH